MSTTMTTEAYLGGSETIRPRELAYGLLREPPAPGLHHQMLVGSLYRHLDAHVRRSRAGRVVLSPVDVVLDREHALIVQPDLVFVSQERLRICDRQIWGAPDLVIEVLSSATRRRDRTIKLGWYRHYGVRECWLVDPVALEIAVFDLAAAAGAAATFSAEQIVRSAVLPRLRLRPANVFGDR